MNEIITQPSPWNYFVGDFIECCVNAFVNGIMLCIVGLPIIAIISAVGGQMPKIRERLARYAGLMAVLVPVSGFYATLWFYMVQGKCYISYNYDSDDDFRPFLPISLSDISYGGGYLVSSFGHIQFLWMLFSMLTWATTFLVYRISRQFIKYSQLPPNFAMTENKPQSC